MLYVRLLVVSAFFAGVMLYIGVKNDRVVPYVLAGVMLAYAGWAGFMIWRNRRA